MIADPSADANALTEFSGTGLLSQVLDAVCMERLHCPHVSEWVGLMFGMVSLCNEWLTQLGKLLIVLVQTDSPKFSTGPIGTMTGTGISVSF